MICQTCFCHVRYPMMLQCQQDLCHKDLAGNAYSLLLLQSQKDLRTTCMLCLVNCQSYLMKVYNLLLPQSHRCLRVIHMICHVICQCCLLHVNFALPKLLVPMQLGIFQTSCNPQEFFREERLYMVVPHLFGNLSSSRNPSSK